MRRERKAMHMGTQVLQPLTEPRALEPGVAGDPNGFAAVKSAEHSYQIFHGASPAAHRASSCCCSR